MSETKKPQTKKPEQKTNETKAVAGSIVKQAFQINGKKYLVGDKCPKAISEKKELKGFF